MSRSLLMVILFAFSASASAQYYKYNYIQGSFGQIKLDGSFANLEGEGLGIGGSFAIDPNFNVFGEYQSVDPSPGAKLDLLEFGVSYHADVSPYLDLVANLSYVDLETNSGGGDDGFAFGIGLRGSVSDATELYGGLDYINFNRFDSETRATAGIMLNLTESLGVGLKASIWKDVNVFNINARLYFD